MTDGVTAPHPENTSKISDVPGVPGVTLVPEGNPEEIATTVPQPEAACSLCGEAGILWPNPDDAAGWVHQGCYADQREARARDRAKGARS